MKRINIFSLLIISILIFSNCANESNNSKDLPISNAVKEKGISYDFILPTHDLKSELGAGILFWKGESITEFHNGAVHLKNGNLYSANDQIVGAEVEIPIVDLLVTDLHDENKFKFEDHLKSIDFFDTKKHPLANIYVDKIEANTNNEAFAYTGYGVLELKGIKNRVSFPFNYKLEDSKFLVESDHFTINRTDWGIKYKSKILGVSIDEAIKDEIRIKFKFFTRSGK